MQAFKTRWFARFAKQERIADSSLREAIERAERGLIDADLGGGLIKQRLARKGQGRSGGYRAIIAYCIRNRAVFLCGFAKSERGNISTNELELFRELAKNWLGTDIATFRREIDAGNLQEVKNGEEA